MTTIPRREVNTDDLLVQVRRALRRARTGGRTPLDELLGLASDARRHPNPQVRAVGDALWAAIADRTVAPPQPALRLHSTATTDQEDQP